MAKTITNEEYQIKLLEEFDNLTSEEILGLISKTKTYLVKFEQEDINRDYLITGILESSSERKGITFKQWKALSAFCRDCKKLEDIENKFKSINTENKFKSFLN
jgi:hypothetical protein